MHQAPRLEVRLGRIAGRAYSFDANSIIYIYQDEVNPDYTLCSRRAI